MHTQYVNNCNAHVLQRSSLVGLWRANQMPQLMAAAQAFHILSLGQSSSESWQTSASQTDCKGKRPSGTTDEWGLWEGPYRGSARPGTAAPTHSPRPSWHYLQLFCPASSGISHTSTKVSSLPAQLSAGINALNSEEGYKQCAKDQAKHQAEQTRTLWHCSW